MTVTDEMKTCNICNVEKMKSEFLNRHRRCKACQYEINKNYSKSYYQENKKRLIDMNKENYKIKNTSRGKLGRPRKEVKTEGGVDDL